MEEYKTEKIEKEPMIGKIDLKLLKETNQRSDLSIDLTLTKLIDSGLITEQGIRIQGLGILIRKIEKLCEMVDKTNLKLHFIEKKLEK